MRGTINLVHRVIVLQFNNMCNGSAHVYGAKHDGTTIRKLANCRVFAFEGKVTKMVIALLSDAWRQFSETGKSMESKIEKDLIEMKPPKNTQVLFVGPAGAGKSSFIDSLVCVGKKRLSRPAQSGKANENDTSYTLKLNRYKEDRLLEGLDLMDCMGLDANTKKGFHFEDYKLLLEGHIKLGYEFSEEPISKYNDSYKEKPSIEDKVHCLVFVIDIIAIRDGLPGPNTRVINEMRNAAKCDDIPVVMILTKADLLTDIDKTCSTKIFQNGRMYDMVKKVSELFNIEECDIHPVTNYCKETELKKDMNIVLLSAMRRIKQSAIDCITNKINGN